MRCNSPKLCISPAELRKLAKDFHARTNLRKAAQEYGLEGDQMFANPCTGSE